MYEFTVRWADMHNIWSNGINIGEIYTKLKSYTSLQTVIFIILLFLIKAALISGSNKKNLYNIAKSLSRKVSLQHQW